MRRFKSTAQTKMQDVSLRGLNKGPRAHFWPLRMIAFLLLLQAAALGTITIFDSPWITGFSASGNARLPAQPINAVFIRGTFTALALLAALAALGVLRVLHIAWILALVVQAVLLLLCLFLYVQHRPVGVYPMMLLSIMLVLYLNSRDARVAFRIRSSPPAEQFHEH